MVKKNRSGLFWIFLGFLLLGSLLFGVFFSSQQSVLFVSEGGGVVSGDVSVYELFGGNVSVFVSVKGAERFAECYDVNDWKSRYNVPICSWDLNHTDFGCPVYAYTTASAVCEKGCTPNQGLCYCGSGRWRNKISSCAVPSAVQFKGGATFFDAGGYCVVNVSGDGFYFNSSPVTLLFFGNGSFVDLNEDVSLNLSPGVRYEYFSLRVSEESFYESTDEDADIVGRGCVGGVVDYGVLKSDVPEPVVAESPEIVDPIEVPAVEKSFIAPFKVCAYLSGLFVNDTCFVQTSEICGLYHNITLDGGLGCVGESVVCRDGDCRFREEGESPQKVSASLPSRDISFISRVMFFIKEVFGLQ